MHTPSLPRTTQGNTRAVAGAASIAKRDPFFDNRNKVTDPRRRRTKFITVSVSRRDNIATVYA